MNICECGCGEQCKKRFVRGHQLRKRPIPPEVSPEWNDIQARAMMGGNVALERLRGDAIGEPAVRMPPPFPLPFDHRLFRLAVEPPGTLMTDPWKAVPCAECKEICFTRQANAEYGSVICEEDLWRLMEDRGEAQKLQNRTMVRLPYDPFR